jgi:hypothetical protein
MTIIGGKGEIGLHGTVGILNVGEGDTKLSFDPNNPQERERAAKIVTEMLRLGFAIMIEVEIGGEKLFRRVHAFDESTCEYVIFGDAHEPAAAATTGEARAEGTEAPGAPPAPKPKGRRARTSTIIPASAVRAVGVARSAGG